MFLRRLGLIVALLAPVYGYAQMGASAPKSETAQKIEKALASPIRSDDERARDDRERKPVQTLEFFGLKPNMTVVELMPGAGWYTKILGLTLAEQGKLYVTLGAGRIAPRLKEWGLDKVEYVDDKTVMKAAPGTMSMQAESIKLPLNNVDMVLTFRNLHNFNAESRAMLHRAVFDALKPGGVYGIVDHTRRHNEPTTRENWRRIDPVLVIKEILDAGFVFDGFVDLHYRPDDELRYDTQRPTVAGYSDRFTFRFRKPAP